MSSPMLVDCSSCRTQMHLPPGAQSIRCDACHAVTHIADPHSAPPQPHSSVPQWNAPSPWSGSPPGPPPNAHGRKKAVIVGIAYRNKLKGPINDAKCMRYLLVNKFKFPESSILMLTEEETDPYRIPTKHNMRMAMNWLVQGCQPGDSLVFHYSGRASQQRNRNGEEADGYDETLCPLDYKEQGVIVDDEINATLVRPLPPDVKLHALIDASHSGTMLDLPFLCRMNRKGEHVWEDHRPKSGAWKGSNGGEVIAFSSCDDSQKSAHTSALSKITPNGALTFCFIQAIERGHGGTYGSILNSMGNAFRNASKIKSGGSVAVKGVSTAAYVFLTGDILTPLISMLLKGGSASDGGGGLKQEPQLTACEKFDVYAKPFAM